MEVEIDGCIRNSFRLRKQTNKSIQCMNLKFGFQNKPTPKSDILDTIRESEYTLYIMGLLVIFLILINSMWFYRALVL